LIILKILLELKKITASALAKLSKAPRIRSAGAFVLPRFSAPKRKCKTLMVLRHYTSGKPCLSSVFSLASDPKPQQADPIRRPFRPD
jgi:hypothetical protein